MAARIQTEATCALPPAPRHSITTHLPGWPYLLRFIDRDPELMSSFKSMYPRMLMHVDVKEVKFTTSILSCQWLTKDSLLLRFLKRRVFKGNSVLFSHGQLLRTPVKLSLSLQVVVKMHYPQMMLRFESSTLICASMLSLFLRPRSQLFNHSG